MPTIGDFSYQNVLEWYQSRKRSLPWRMNWGHEIELQLYRTWISEIMSQQSTLKTVVPRYEKWMTLWPDLKSLKKAKFKDVQNVWAGLGYYSRANNIFKAAQEIKNLSDFKTSDELKSIPGVGDYTARAMAAICWDEPTVGLDGNVLRTASRFFEIEDPQNNSAHRNSIREVLEKIAVQVPLGQRGNFAQALIELGATVCLPQSRAKCSECPLSDSCRSLKSKRVAEIPLPKLRNKILKKEVLALLYTNPKSKDEILLREIPKDFPLMGQLEIPWVGLDGWRGLRSKAVQPQPLFKSLKLNDIIGLSKGVKGPVRHQIMHYSMQVYVCDLGVWRGPVPEKHFFRKVDHVEGLTTQSKKLLKCYLDL